jgi:ADP-heptose:LPS heptosyltransferase
LKELGGEVHWVTRSDLAILIEGHPMVEKIWKLDRATGIQGLFHLIFQLKKERYSHIYDAHNNLRSFLISLFLRPPFALSRIFDPPLFIRKSQKRWKRLMLFRFRKNLYRLPFSGQRDLLEPLKQWGLSEQIPPAPQINIQSISEAQIQQILS